MTRKSALIRRLLFSVAMFVIVLGTAELAARFLGTAAIELASSPLPLAEEGAPNLLGNPYLLWEMSPGLRQEMEIDVHINRYGLRGTEWELDKPEGIRRVMAVGDSSVYGFGVHDDQVFTAFLDQALGDKVQVLNSAVPGYSTYQIINLLEIRSLAFQPDLLIVASLWSDNNFDSFVDSDMLAAYSSFRNRSSRGVKERLKASSLFTVLDYKLRVVRKFPEERRVGWMVGRGEKIGKRRVPINEYARNLETMAELAHGVGCELLFVILPNSEDMLSTYEQGAAWDPYREVMADSARRHGAPLLDMPELFRASRRAQDELFLDEMHPTALGHRMIADAIHQRLVADGWMSGVPLERDPVPSAIPTWTDPFSEGEHSAPDQPAPDPSTLAAQPKPEEAPRVSIAGQVVAPDFPQSPIQLDIITQAGSTHRILGTHRLPTPGPFELQVEGTPTSVAFIIYVDENGDGPGPGDTRIDLTSSPIPVPEAGELTDVVLDLSQGSAVRTFAADEQPPAGGTGPAPDAIPREATSEKGS